MTLQNKLKLLRIEYGFKQVDLAKYLNINLITYNQKENRKADFKLVEAKKLADLFGVKIEEIFRFDKEN